MYVKTTTTTSTTITSTNHTNRNQLRFSTINAVCNLSPFVPVYSLSPAPVGVYRCAAARHFAARHGRAEGLTFDHEMTGHSFDLNLTALSAGADDTWPNTTMVRSQPPPPPSDCGKRGVTESSLFPAVKLSPDCSYALPSFGV